MNKDLKKIRAALAGYKLLADHMHDNVCQSYEKDSEVATVALRLFDEHVAAINQPVASVPQDVEEWLENDYCLPHECSVGEHVIDVTRIRTFLTQRDAGHVRVPVELSGGMWSNCRNELQRVYDRIKYAMTTESESVEFDAAPQSIWDVLLTASKEGKV